VAGSRESKSPGIQNDVMRVMLEVISQVNGTTFYPPAGRLSSGWILREAKPGDVVRLTDLSEGREPGLYVLLHQTEKSITLCPIGEDEDGDMCRTDEEIIFSSRITDRLKPTGLNVNAE